NKSEYGSPRIWRELDAADIACGENRVARLMRFDKLVALQKRKFCVTTHSKHGFPVWPNIVNRNFIIPAPDKTYVSDITYVWTMEGWLFVAVVLDLFSRGVVGLSMDESIADSLTQAALKQAILRRNPAQGLIFHSDRGRQYASNDFKALLLNHKFIGSMSKKGDCWDNAVAESFFHTLKVECIRGKIFRTREEAKRTIFAWAYARYNRTRRHSTLDYLSPFEYERRYKLTLNNVH
ncbi:MAG: IS3 family transposase, partial [Candidatus Omnitrophota bacterium]